MVIIISKQKAKTTKSWNPFVGCNYNCVYCVPVFQSLLRSQPCDECKKYSPHEHSYRLDRLYGDKIIFVCTTGDIAFANPDFMKRMLQVMKRDKKTGRVWLLQSKNPSCLEQYLPLLPENTYLVTTLETNRDERYEKISDAPKPSVRYAAFKALDWSKKIVNVEPIMDFDLEIFEDWIVDIDPVAVFIGYNSKPYAVSIPEPDKKKTWMLFNNLKNRGMKVLPRDMRDPSIKKMNYVDLFSNSEEFEPIKLDSFE